MRGTASIKLAFKTRWVNPQSLTGLGRLTILKRGEPQALWKLRKRREKRGIEPDTPGLTRFLAWILVHISNGKYINAKHQP